MEFTLSECTENHTCKVNIILYNYSKRCIKKRFLSFQECFHAYPPWVSCVQEQGSVQETWESQEASPQPNEHKDSISNRSSVLMMDMMNLLITPFEMEESMNPIVCVILYQEVNH